MEWPIGFVDVQPTNLEQVCDADMPTWTKISEVCSLLCLDESLQRRIKVGVKGEGGVQRLTSADTLSSPLLSLGMQHYSSNGSVCTTQ